MNLLTALKAARKDPSLGAQLKQGKFQLVSVTYPNGPKRACRVEVKSEWIPSGEFLAFLAGEVEKALAGK